jgi:SAM-dependent methyltransferase
VEEFNHMAKGSDWRLVSPLMRACFPPYRRALKANAALKAENARLQRRVDELDGMPLFIKVSRGESSWKIEPSEFETFPFENGDVLAVLPKLPTIWEDTNINIEPGRAIRVPPRYEYFEFKGFSIPVHLIKLTGAGPDTFDSIGRAHIENYQRAIGLQSDMTILEIGCGIGRDALQLIDMLSADGRYIGIDVTRDSILWCQNNISVRYPNFVFHHFDAENELYNPFGDKQSKDFELPVEDKSVDRILLASVFTHLFPDEVVHYMRQFRRVLKPSGLVYATFFLYSEAAIAAAQTKGNTSWKATFAHPCGDGAYSNDPVYPRGAIAFTDEAMRRMIGEAGLRLMKPYLRGWWSGLHEECDDGQDVAILGV